MTTEALLVVACKLSISCSESLMNRAYSASDRLPLPCHAVRVLWTAKA